MSERACPLPRWPRLARRLHTLGWPLHRLARELGLRPSQVFAFHYGRTEMPAELRRRVERLVGLEPGSLD